MHSVAPAAKATCFPRSVSRTKKTLHLSQTGSLTVEAGRVDTYRLALGLSGGAWLLCTPCQATTPMPYDIIYVHLHGGAFRMGDYNGFQ